MKNNDTKLTCVGAWVSFKNKRVTLCWDGECSELYSFTLIPPGSGSVRCHKHPPPSIPHRYFLRWFYPNKSVTKCKVLCFVFFNPSLKFILNLHCLNFVKNTRLLSKLCCNIINRYTISQNLVTLLERFSYLNYPPWKKRDQHFQNIIHRHCYSKAHQ